MVSRTKRSDIRLKAAGIEKHYGFAMNEEKNEENEAEALQKLANNPVALAQLISQWLEERRSTNLLLREINAKLDRMLVEREEISRPKQKEEVLVAEQDQQILEFVKEQGKADAASVQKRFGYKGKNGASARMNALAKHGLLKKIQVGRKVFFLPVSQTQH